MASTGFFKGEKKKAKKGKATGAPAMSSNAPVFVLPKLVEKKKKDQW